MTNSERLRAMSDKELAGRYAICVLIALIVLHTMIAHMATVMGTDC